MTRSGAISENLSTGESEAISTRPADNNISEQPVNTVGKVLDRADAVHTNHSAKKTTKKAKKMAADGMDAAKRPSSRLQFSDEERAAPDLEKAIRKSDKKADRLDLARENIPKKKKLVRERSFDEAVGKSKSRLHFKESEKPYNGKIKHNALSRPAQEVGTKLHGKIREVEKENVGVEGGHAAEQFGEKAVGKGYRAIKGGIRRHVVTSSASSVSPQAVKLLHSADPPFPTKSSDFAGTLYKPYRAAAKAEQASIKANTNYLYQKALHDNPQLASSPLSRFMQKQQIKRNYAKQIRDTGKTAQKTGGALKSAAVKAKEVAKQAASFVTRHWKGLLALLGLGLMLVFLMGGLQSCSSMFGGVSSSVLATTYLSEDTEILVAEASYSALEAELQYEVDNYASLHPGFDEYRFNLDGIYHDPHELAAYLSAKYATYTASSVQAEIQRIFGLQYELSTQETTEIRYRTETYTDENGDSHTVRVPYNYYIITVTLVNRGIYPIAQSELTPEQMETYNVYRQTLGNMPLLFGGGSTNTNPAEDLSGVQFVNGTRPGNQNIVNIAQSQVGNVGGQPYWSWYGFGGRVEWCACFVSWCFNQAGYSEPRFAACTSQGMPWFQSHGQWGDRNYANIAPGDAIFFDWDGDGSADHVGIVVGTDGERVYTVEGNSGDACTVRSYSLGSSVIRGYGLMN
mgnify:CR=1 FL=1